MNWILALLFTLPLWTAPVDSRTSDQWMAESPGRVYVNRGAHVAALDVKTGKPVWTAGVGALSAPAYFRGALAVPNIRGIRFLDAKTGALRRTYFLNGPSAVASTASAIVAAKYGTGITNAVFGFDAYGHVLWRQVIDTGYSAAIFSLGGDLAGIESFAHQSLTVIDARTGRITATIEAVGQIVGGGDRYLWLTIDNGGLEGVDLQTGSRSVYRGHVLSKAVSVEDYRAVAVMDGRLQVLDMRDNSSRPLRINGRWIGGPIDGNILVEAGGTLWVQSLKPNAKPVRVARYASNSILTTSDRDRAFVALANGTILTVDMISKKLLQAIETPCRIFEGVTASGARTLVHCDRDATHSQVVAFRRAL